MRQTVIAALMLLVAGDARATTVYEFALNCREDALSSCFGRISKHLDRLKAGHQGESFCMPRVWGATSTEGEGYPVSVLEHLRLGLSAARFGNAGRDVDDVLRELAAGLYPCE
jgi:AraC-like DNA-binding protein